MNGKSVADEAAALGHIRERWRPAFRWPLGPPCGGINPFEAAVERLQSSALVWPSFDQSSNNHGRLEAIAAAVESALAYLPAYEWKASSLPFGDALAWQRFNAGDYESPLPCGDQKQFPGASWLQWTPSFSPHVHRWARQTFFAMQSGSSSLFDGAHPSKALLWEKGFYSPPSSLRDEHFAVMAAMVCIARALHALKMS
jgi:hypothetical protein